MDPPGSERMGPPVQDLVQDHGFDYYFLARTAFLSAAFLSLYHGFDYYYFGSSPRH